MLLFWEDTCKCRKEGGPGAVRTTAQEDEKSCEANQPEIDGNVLYTGFCPHRRCIGSHAYLCHNMVLPI